MTGPPICVSTCKSWRVMPSVFLHPSPPSNLESGLIQNTEPSSSAEWLTSMPLGLGCLCTPSHHWTWTAWPAFTWWLGDLNLGPHVCTACTLYTVPSPHFSSSFYGWSNYPLSSIIQPAEGQWAPRLIHCNAFVMILMRDLTTDAHTGLSVMPEPRCAYLVCDFGSHKCLLQLKGLVVLLGALLCSQRVWNPVAPWLWHKHVFLPDLGHNL